MKITYDVEVNLDGLQEKLETRFELHSPAQKVWDSMVWNAMRKYVPVDMRDVTGGGGFLAHNEALNEERFGSGEIIFEADPESGYSYQHWWLWTGRSPERVIKQYTNPLSTAYWDNSVVQHDLPTLESEFEEKINRGDV